MSNGYTYLKDANGWVLVQNSTNDGQTLMSINKAGVNFMITLDMKEALEIANSIYDLAQANNPEVYPLPILEAA